MSEELGHTENNFDGVQNPNSEIINMNSLKIVSIKYIQNINALANNSSCTNVTDTDNCDNVNVDLMVKKNLISDGNDNLDTNINSNDTKLINADIQQSDANTSNNLSVHDNEKSGPGITKIDGNDTKQKHCSEDSHFRGFDPLPTPDWVINESWLKLPNHVFNESKN